MENETMLNAEDLGFDAEDLKEVGLDKQEPTTPAGNDPKKPEDNSAGKQPKTDPDPESEPKTKIEPTKEAEDNPAGGDLKKALAEERARRKAAEEAARKTVEAVMKAEDAAKKAGKAAQLKRATSGTQGKKKGTKK